MGTDLKEESSLRETVDKLDCHHDLRQFSASATTALSTVKELAGRQEAALEAASQDLLCSPDIIRFAVFSHAQTDSPFESAKTRYHSIVFHTTKQ